MRFGFDFLPEDVSGGDTGPTVVERKYVDKVTASDGVTYDIQDTVAMERVKGYLIAYTASSDGTLTANTSEVYKQAAIKILELINEGVRPIVYAKISKGLDTYTVPAVVDVGHGSTHTSFGLTFVFSTGYDTYTEHNQSFDYEDTIKVSGTNVTHNIHRTDLRATQVNSNADGNGFLYYWRLPALYKRYEYFNALHYYGPIDEGNDYYQSTRFVIATCNDYHPADGSTFTASLSDFSTITQKYPELPPMLYISFKKYTEAGGTATGDAYWVPISKIIHETGQSGSPTQAGVKGFTGVFVDKDGNFWRVTYDVDTSTGTINALASGGVSGKYEIDLDVNVVGSVATPTFTKINGYTAQADIVTQLHKLYLDLMAGKHPIVTLRYFTNRDNNNITTLCPATVSAVNEHHICIVWEWSVPTQSTADRLSDTRYVNQLLTAHDGTSSNRFTYRTFKLT